MRLYSQHNIVCKSKTRKSSCAKPQEAYRLQHNLPKYHPIPDWEGQRVPPSSSCPVGGGGGNLPHPAFTRDESYPPPPPVDRHIPINITFPRTSYAVGNNPNLESRSQLSSFLALVLWAKSGLPPTRSSPSSPYPC